MISELFVFEKGPFAECHASTLVEVGSDLLCSFFAGAREGAPDVAIYTARWTGDHWMPPVETARHPNTPCWNPVLFQASPGEVLLFYKAGPSPQTWSGFLKRSRDGGQSWSAAEILPAGILGPVKNKPILVGGRLLCGTSVESYEAWGCRVDLTDPAIRSWKSSNPINVPGHPYGIIQPAFLKGRGETVIMLCRARGLGKVVRAVSLDGGRHWEDAAPIDLPHNNSGLDAVTLRDGRSLLAYNHTNSGRTPLNLALTSDEGAVWRPVLTLEREPGEYSYPAVIQSANGRIHISYTWKRKRIRHVSLDPSDLK